MDKTNVLVPVILAEIQKLHNVLALWRYKETVKLSNF